MRKDNKQREKELKEARAKEPDVGTFHETRLTRGRRGQPDRFEPLYKMDATIKQGSTERELELHIEPEALQRLARTITREWTEASNGVFVIRLRPTFLRRLKRPSVENG